MCENYAQEWTNISMKILQEKFLSDSMQLLYAL